MPERVGRTPGEMRVEVSAVGCGEGAAVVVDGWAFTTIVGKQQGRKVAGVQCQRYLAMNLLRGQLEWHRAGERHAGERHPGSWIAPNPACQPRAVSTTSSSCRMNRRPCPPRISPTPDRPVCRCPNDGAGKLGVASYCVFAASMPRFAASGRRTNPTSALGSSS